MSNLPSPTNTLAIHQPVLYQEVITALNPRDGGYYVDGTLGAGGHAWGVLAQSAPGGRLLGLDLDEDALSIARQRLADFGDRAVVLHASYVTLRQQIAQLGWPGVDGILLDLGLSSIQLNMGERGFSFLSDAPLDMRFDQSATSTMQPAADLVNTLSENELADIIYHYGEERRAYQVARAIVQARPLHTTRQLAAVVAGVVRGGQIHPATRTFQALRIAVNDELHNVETVLPEALAALAPGGRLAVISFHSLEDRLVKQFFRQESRNCICPPRQPVCTCGHRAQLVEIVRQPLRPASNEVAQNPRSRSARLRVAEKIAPSQPSDSSSGGDSGAKLAWHKPGISLKPGVKKWKN